MKSDSDSIEPLELTHTYFGFAFHANAVSILESDWWISLGGAANWIKFTSQRYYRNEIETEQRLEGKKSLEKLVCGDFVRISYDKQSFRIDLCQVCSELKCSVENGWLRLSESWLIKNIQGSNPYPY